MKRCFSFAETGAADRAAIAAGTPALELMERAGRQLKERVTAVMKAINRKAIKARQPKGPGTDWVLDAASVEEYKARRDRREARR